MSDESVWQNDEQVVLLNGDPIPQDMDFPVEPPPEIGQVKAVYSTCVVGKPLRSGKKRIAIICLVFFLLALPITVIVGLGNDLDAWLFGGAMGGVFGLISMPFSIYYTRGKNWIAFVGEFGLARYTLGAERDKIKKVELFEFVNAVDLYTHVVTTTVNLVYAGTTYNSKWCDATGKQVFALSGRHNSKQGTPKANSPYYLATAAESMWTTFLADAINIELKEQGAVHFKVNKKDWVKIGPGFMEFHFKGKTARLDVEDIKDLRLGGGQFLIKSQDAGWLGGKGKYGFAYDKMANAKLFLMCLEQLCGYSFE